MDIFKHTKIVKKILLTSFLISLGSVVRTLVLFYFPDVFGIGIIMTALIISMLVLSTIIGAFAYVPLNRKLGISLLYKLIVILGTLSYVICSFFYDNFFIVFPFMLVSYFCMAISGLIIKKSLLLNTEETTRKKAFSLNYILINLAFMIGPVIALTVYSMDINNIRYIFLVDALSTIVSYAIFKDILKLNNYEEKTKEKIMDSKVNFKLFYIAIMLFLISLGFGNYGFLMPKAVEYTFSVDIYRNIMIINTFLCVVTIPFIHKFFSSKNERNNILIGLVLIILSYILYALNTSVLIVYLATVVITLGEVYYAASLDTYLAQMVDKDEFDKVLVINNLQFKASQVINPILISIIIYYTSSYVSGYVAGALFIMIAMVMLLKLKRK